MLVRTGPAMRVPHFALRCGQLLQARVESPALRFVPLIHRDGLVGEPVHQLVIERFHHRSPIILECTHEFDPADE